MFENLLQLAADDDKATLTTMATKYPTLKEYFELGEKVKPVRERLKAINPKFENDFEAPVKALEDWQSWRNKEWADWQKEHTRVEQALADATVQISELEASRGIDMTKEEVAEIVTATLKAAGVATTQEIDTRMEKYVNEKVSPGLESRVDALNLRYEDVIDKLEDVRDKHRDALGENLRPRDVFKFMKDNKIMDVEEAWQKMTATKFAEKSKAQTEAEKKAEYEKGVAEGKKAALQEVGSQRSPVDGGGGTVARPGALLRRAQARMPKKADGELDSSKIPLGKGIARVATQEYYDKKAGAVQ